MFLGKKLPWHTCGSTYIDVSSLRAAELMFIAIFWRSHVISSYAIANIE